MEKQKAHKIVLLFAASALLLITGCAGTETTDNDRRQGPPAMGNNSRGGMQGPPQGMSHNDRDSEDSKTNKTPPAEAIAACIEKKLGDHVEFTGPRGEVVIAVCQVYEDHLVAVPEERMSKND